MIVQAESNQNGEAMQMTDNIHSSMLENEWGWQLQPEWLDCRGAADYQRSAAELIVPRANKPNIQFHLK